MIKTQINLAILRIHLDRMFTMQVVRINVSQNTEGNKMEFLTQCLTNEFQFVQVVLNECN